MSKVRHSYNLRTGKFRPSTGQEAAVKATSNSASTININLWNQVLANAKLTKNIVKAKDNDLLNRIVEDKNVPSIFRKRMRRKLWDSPFGFANVDSMMTALVAIECNWATLLEFVDPQHKAVVAEELQALLEQ